MTKFNTTLLGYNKKSVDQYFVEMERQSESMIKAKYGELDALRESIQRSRSKLKMNEKEMENFSQRKEKIFNTFVDQLVVIEQSIKVNEEQLRQANLAELELLEEKVRELEKWTSLLHQCYNDISVILNKYRNSFE